MKCKDIEPMLLYENTKTPEETQTIKQLIKFCL
jgi:hypothetical protein